jgi:predicted AAA+ superfamily ATPase
MWIPRLVEPRLRQLAATRPVVVLTGARQTGKTALSRHLFPDHHYVTLDLPSEAAQAESDPEAFLARHPPPLIVDEVQYAPGLFRHLKVAVDRQRQRNGQFILTGSQPFALMQGVAESLAGRAAVLQLEGLSTREIEQALPDLSVSERASCGRWRCARPSC